MPSDVDKFNQKVVFLPVVNKKLAHNFKWVWKKQHYLILMGS